MKIIGKSKENGKYRQNRAGRTHCQYLMKIMRQMWKLANIARMGFSADQQQYPMKIIREFWKLANIAKMSPRASQCRFPVEIMGKI